VRVQRNQEALPLRTSGSPLSQPGTAQSVVNTLIFASGSALVGTFLGTFLAFIVARTDARFSKAVGYAVVLLVALPFFVVDMAWTYLANPTNGLLNILLWKAVEKNYLLCSTCTVWEE